MADRPAVKVKPITRDKLATFLGSHELIKAFENLVEDVGVTLPDASLNNARAIDTAQESADTAIAASIAARAIVEVLRPLVDDLIGGPPAVPPERVELEEMIPRVAQLESTITRLAHRVRQLEEGPP